MVPRIRPGFRWLFLALLVVGLVGAAACGPAATPTPTPTSPAQTTPTTRPTATPTPTPGVQAPEPKNPAGTVVFAVERVPSGTGLNSAQGNANWYGATETAFRSDVGAPPSGFLVKSFTLAPDLSKVTMELRQGVQFHKGFGEMTAEDFAWNMNDTNAKTNPTSIAGMAGDYAALFGEAKATGPYTVEVPFAQFDVTWTANQMNQESISFAVFSKRACDQNGLDWCRENMVGTGPFEVREWIKDDRIVLDAVQSHWDKVPQIKTLRYVAVPEATSRVAMLQTGEADMARVVIKDIRDLRAKGFKTADAHAVRQVPINYAGNFWEEKHALTGEPLNVTLDLTKPWIGDPKDPARMESARKVRWALAVAYDRELISEQVFNGEGKPYYTQMFNPDDPNWQDKWAIPYDPAMAERLLDEAGYPKQSNGIRFEMELFGALDVPEWGELVDAVAGFWTNIGVKTSVVKTNYSVFRPSLVQRTNTTPFSQQCRHDRGAPWDWPRGHQLTSLTRGGFGCGSEIPFVLETLNKTASEVDVQKRIQYNNDLADYLHNWMLASGVVSLPQLVVYNPRSIQSWDMRDCFECEFNSPELIVPASR